MATKTTTRVPKRAGIYARISDDREGKGLGVERQRVACEKEAKARGYVVAATYTDNDLSAYSGKPRPGYDLLMDDLQAGKLDAVICWHPDRLHRSPLELEGYIAVCDPRSIPTFAVKSGEYDLSTATGRMTARIVGAVARHESEHQSEKIVAKMAELASTGKHHGGPRPFGFEWDGKTIRDGEAQEIRNMAEAVLSGVPLGSVARDLNQRGVKTVEKHGCPNSAGSKRDHKLKDCPTLTYVPWSPTVVRNMLLKPRLAGKTVLRGQAHADADHPAILDLTDWKMICSVLRDPARRTSTGTKAKYLLSGVLKCGVCGKGMTRTTVGKDRRKIYRCCVFPQAERLEWKAEFLARLLLCSPDVLRVLLRPKKQNRTLDNRIDALRNRLDAAALSYAHGDLSVRQYQATSKIMESELTELESQNVDDVSARVLGSVEPGFSQEMWKNLSTDRKRALIDFLLDVTALPKGKVRIKPKHHEIEWGKIALSATEKDELSRLIS